MKASLCLNSMKRIFQQFTRKTSSSRGAVLFSIYHLLPLPLLLVNRLRYSWRATGPSLGSAFPRGVLTVSSCRPERAFFPPNWEGFEVGYEVTFRMPWGYLEASYLGGPLPTLFCSGSVPKPFLNCNWTVPVMFCNRSGATIPFRIWKRF